MDKVRRDELLLELYEDRKNIGKFLDAVFGFLRRKTNFFEGNPEDEEADNLPELLTLGALERNTPGADKPPHPQQQAQQTYHHHHHCVSEYAFGGLFENYCWKQSSTAVVVNVKLPLDLESATHLTIDLRLQSLNIRDRTKDTESGVILAGMLAHRVRSTDVLWTVCMADRMLRITIEKPEDIWWTCFLQNEVPPEECTCDHGESVSTDGGPEDQTDDEMGYDDDILVSQDESEEEEEEDDEEEGEEDGEEYEDEEETVEPVTTTSNRSARSEATPKVSSSTTTSCFAAVTASKRAAIAAAEAAVAEPETTSIADSVKRLRKSSDSLRSAQSSSGRK